MRGLSYTSILVAVLCVSVCTATDLLRPVLKFGNNETDYVIFAPNMRPFRSQFSICSWVKRLETSENLRYWFSYESITPTHKTLASTDEDFVPGRWTHYCMVWSMSSGHPNLYFNGTAKRPSNSSIGMPHTHAGGFLALGQKARGDGTTINSNTARPFGGELHKFNIFSKMLSAEEVREMYEAGICSTIEEKYGPYRKLKWDNIINRQRHGNVQLVNLDVSCPSTFKLSYAGVPVLPVETESAETESESVTDLGIRLDLAELDIDWNRANFAWLVGLKLRRFNDLSSDLFRTQADISKTRNKLEATENALQKTRSDLWETKTELVRTKSDFQELQTELLGTRYELEATETALHKTQSDLEETQTELERTKTDLHEKLDQTQGELNVTRADLNETRSELESTKLDLKEMISRFYRQFQSSQIVLETVQSSQDYIENSYEEKEEELEAMRQQLELVQIRQDRTEKKQEKKEKELEAMRKQLKKTEKRLKKLLARNSGEG